MGFGIDRRARSPRAKSGLRALIARAPDARETGDRLVRIARRMLKGAVVDASPRRVTLSFHPAAPPVRIVVLPDGDLEIRGETSGLGPGYHAYVLAQLAPVLDELDYVWDGPPETVAGTTPDEMVPGTVSIAGLQRAMTGWLADQLRAGETRIGIPAERAFQLEAAVLTAMGPRDRAWCEAVIADPARGADAFAWWDSGPGQLERSRALLAMWFEVPWREPIDTAERDLMEQVDADLEAARRADATLALPWPEWAELRALLGEDDLAELRSRAAGQAPVIGYRRHPIEIELAGGWSIVLPGAFVGRWEDDGERYWATDGDRMIEFTSLTASGELGSQALLEVAPEKHPVIARIAEPDRCGRAEAYDEGPIHVVHGLMASAPEVAILTCKSGVADEPWALETWRSLRQR